MAIRAYNSPGVTVSEVVNPSLAPVLAIPSIGTLVGPARGEQTATERVRLSETDPVSLLYTGVQTSSVVVKNSITGEVINAGNYVVTAGADPDATVTGDEPFTLARVAQPTAAPVAAVGTGTLTGTFVYAYSFVNARGETGISPISGQVVLANQGADLSAIAVGPAGTTARNVYRAEVVGGVPGTFFQVATIGNNTATTLTGENSAATTTEPEAGIADGATVIVSYDYTDQYYFEPTYFEDFDDVAAKYGDPFTADGAINSLLSFAAMIAFMNGAGELVLLASEGSTGADFSQALDKLESEETVRMIACVSGDTAVHANLAAHVTSMASRGLYRMGIIGRDGTTTPIAAVTLRNSQVYNNEAIIMVSPTSFKMTNPITGRDMFLGGQYAAAAVLGMFSARDVNISLTRKTVAGFTGVGDSRTATELALDSSAGLMVIEERNGVLRVRHGVTTSAQSVNTRESSVVRQKYDMAHRLRNGLDPLIGLVAPMQDAPLIVQSQVSGILEQLVIEGLISNYQNVKARLLPSDPTAVEVRFQYAPTYPINNIDVRFTINTQTGEFEGVV